MNPPSSAQAPSDPVPSPRTVPLLERYIALGEDLQALARETGHPYARLLAWLAAPHTRALLEAHDQARTRASAARHAADQECFDRTRIAALQALRGLIDRPDASAADACRAATAILRAVGPARPPSPARPAGTDLDAAVHAALTVELAATLEDAAGGPASTPADRGGGASRGGGAEACPGVTPSPLTSVASDLLGPVELPPVMPRVRGSDRRTAGLLAAAGLAGPPLPSIHEHTRPDGDRRSRR